MYGWFKYKVTFFTLSVLFCLCFDQLISFHYCSLSQWAMQGH